MQVTPLDKPWFGPVAALVVVLLAAVLGMGVPAQILEPLIIENGPFEITSVALHLGVAALAFHQWRKGQSIAGLLFFASLLMAAREMDLHKAFTTYGIFKTRLYVEASVSLVEKLAAGGTVLAILAIMGRLWWKARKDISALYHQRHPAFFALCALPLYLVMLKKIDGVPRMLRKAGMALSERETLISRSIEEIGETFIPLLVLIVVMQMMRSTHQSKHQAAILPAAA